MDNEQSENTRAREGWGGGGGGSGGRNGGKM